MDGSMFGGIDVVFKTMFVLLIVFVPLGMWKAIEIIIWLFNNVNVTVGS